MSQTFTEEDLLVAAEHEINHRAACEEALDSNDAYDSTVMAYAYMALVQQKRGEAVVAEYGTVEDQRNLLRRLREGTKA